MDKFKALLSKAGCKAEFVDAICESIESYRKEIKEQGDVQVTARVEAAKKICLEETEKHKRDLARRVQVFCETKQSAVEASHARQAALSESDTVTKLKSIKGLLEGVVLNGTDNGQTTAVTESAKRQIQQAQDAQKQAVTTANRQTALSEKLLAKNKQLVTENAQLKQSLAAKQPVAENAPAKRLDANRRQNGPAITTRPTLTESQTRQPIKPTGQGNTRVEGNRAGYSVADIASTIE